MRGHIEPQRRTAGGQWTLLMGEAPIREVLEPASIGRLRIDAAACLLKCLCAVGRRPRDHRQWG